MSRRARQGFRGTSSRESVTYATECLGTQQIGPAAERALTLDLKRRESAPDDTHPTGITTSPRAAQPARTVSPARPSSRASFS
jgi:hypothetical protein